MVVPRTQRARPAANDFARLVQEPPTEAERLQRGVELVVTLISSCDHAGVTILTPAFVETVAVSDDVVRRGDGWEHELSEGPGLESVRSRTTVVSQDVGRDPRWRSWGPLAVARLGVRSALSVLLELPDDTVGSLTLYGDRTNVWDDDQRRLSRSLARALARAATDARLLDEQQRSLVARTGVGQAQGIVMERLGMTADEASDHLRRLAQGTQMTLVHLAERIVETRELPAVRDAARPA